jgi:hypothetical protein
MDGMEASKVNLNMAQNFWERGSDWCVRKVGKKWALLDCFGNFPLFKTKKEAYEMATNFILLER